jgi:hypothetical protein
MRRSAMSEFTLRSGDSAVIVRGSVKFVVIETRGDTVVGYAAREPLPYAVFCQERLVARLGSRPLAAAVLNHIEE